MSDLREHLLLAASDIEGDWPSAAELRTRGAQRRTRRRVAAATVVGASAVVAVAFAAAQHPSARELPVTPAVPCPVVVTAPTPVPESDVPTVDVKRGRIALSDATGVWVTAAGRAPLLVASTTDHFTSRAGPGLPSAPQLAWSPVGDELAMTTRANGGDVLAGCGDVALVQADGSGVRLLSHNPVGSTAFLPTFSPDGRTVAYVVLHLASYSGPDPSVSPGTPEGHVSLVLAPLAGRDREFPLDCWPDDVPVWSPDGGHLAISCNEGVAVVSTQDGVATQVTLPEGRMSAGIGWRDDGTLLAALPEAGPSQKDLLISSYDLATGEWTQISHPALHPEWSVPFPLGGFAPSGGELLATEAGDDASAGYPPTFDVIDVASGESTAATDLTTHVPWMLVSWDPGSDTLLVGEVARGSARFFLTPPGGGAHELVATAPATILDGGPGRLIWNDR